MLQAQHAGHDVGRLLAQELRALGSAQFVPSRRAAPAALAQATAAGMPGVTAEPGSCAQGRTRAGCFLKIKKKPSFRYRVLE
jgi:hypothetical protein